MASVMVKVSVMSGMQDPGEEKEADAGGDDEARIEARAIGERPASDAEGEPAEGDRGERDGQASGPIVDAEDFERKRDRAST